MFPEMSLMNLSSLARSAIGTVQPCTLMETRDCINRADLNLNRAGNQAGRGGEGRGGTAGAKFQLACS